MPTAVHKKATETETKKEGSSFIFSLAELSRMEEERVRAQAEAEVRKREAAIALAAEEAARAEAEEERRRRAIEEEERARAAEERETHARLAAMSEAARVKAEVTARAEAEEKRRAEERSLEKVRLETSARAKRRVGMGALVGAVVMLVGALGVQIGVVQPANASRVAEVRVLADQRACDLDALKDKLEAEGKSKTGIAGELAQANARATELAEENAGLKKQIESLSHTKPVVAQSASAVATGAPTRVLPPQEVIPPGFHRCTAEQATRTKDPMCWTTR